MVFPLSLLNVVDASMLKRLLVLCVSKQSIVSIDRVHAVQQQQKCEHQRMRRHKHRPVTQPSIYLLLNWASVWYILPSRVLLYVYRPNGTWQQTLDSELGHNATLLPRSVAAAPGNTLWRQLR